MSASMGCIAHPTDCTEMSSAAVFFSPTTTLTAAVCTSPSTAGEGIIVDKRQRHAVGFIDAHGEHLVALLEEPELEQLVCSSSTSTLE